MNIIALAKEGKELSSGWLENKLALSSFLQLVPSDFISGNYLPQ